METKPEIATIEANCEPMNGFRLYWAVSRTQLEFILQNVEVFHSPPFVATAQYQEKMLPVVSLENHFGLAGKQSGKSAKHLVLRAADADRGLIRLIIETPHPVKLQKVELGDAASYAGLALPKNNMDVFGIFTLSPSELAVVPDLAGISRSLKLRGDYTR